jgi:hypothetical protein
MCNIALIYNKLHITDKIPFLLDVLTGVSYESNNDSEGALFSDGHVAKALGKLIYHNYPIELKWSVTHQRRATSGLKDPEGNIHPVESEGWKLFHNGIISSLGDDQESDSNKLVQLLTGNLKDNTIEESISATFKELNGSASCVLVNPENNRILYFRHGARINLVETDEWIGLFTEKYLAQLFEMHIGATAVEIKEIEEDKIFEITDTGLKDIGKFAMKKVEYKFDDVTDTGYGGYYGTTLWKYSRTGLNSSPYNYQLGEVETILTTHFATSVFAYNLVESTMINFDSVDKKRLKHFFRKHKITPLDIVKTFNGGYNVKLSFKDFKSFFNKLTNRTEVDEKLTKEKATEIIHELNDIEMETEEEMLNYEERSFWNYGLRCDF